MYPADTYIKPVYPVYKDDLPRNPVFLDDIPNYPKLVDLPVYPADTYCEPAYPADSYPIRYPADTHPVRYPADTHPVTYPDCDCYDDRDYYCPPALEKCPAVVQLPGPCESALCAVPLCYCNHGYINTDWDHKISVDNSNSCSDCY